MLIYLVNGFDTKNTMEKRMQQRGSYKLQLLTCLDSYSLETFKTIVKGCMRLEC